MQHETLLIFVPLNILLNDVLHDQMVKRSLDNQPFDAQSLSESSIRICTNLTPSRQRKDALFVTPYSRGLFQNADTSNEKILCF